MAKGNGQCSNYNHGSGDPSLWGIRFRVLEHFRDCRDGRAKCAEYPAFYVHKIEELCEELTREAERVLSASEYDMLENRTQQSVSSDCAIAELDLDVRTCNTLEDHGILFARELAEWTEQELLSVPGIGSMNARMIKAELAVVGLELRKPGVGEAAGEEPVVDGPAKGGAYADDIPKTIAAKRRAAIVAMAAGESERRANEIAGLAREAHWWTGEAKRRIRERLRECQEPEGIAIGLGFLPGKKHFAAVVAWVESLRTRKPGRRYKPSRQANCAVRPRR